MRNETTTETVLLAEDDLIPIAIIAMEIGETVDRMVHRFGVEVETDDVGMRAVSATAARRFFTERAEQRARQEEPRRRRAAQKAQKPVLVGVPAVEGMSPFESMAAAGGLVSPHEEFGGLEKPNFLEEELAAGRRTAAEKERLVKTLKKDLG